MLPLKWRIDYDCDITKHPTDPDWRRSGRYGEVRKKVCHGQCVAEKTITITGNMLNDKRIVVFAKELYAYTELRSYSLVRFIGYWKPISLDSDMYLETETNKQQKEKATSTVSKEEGTQTEHVDILNQVKIVEQEDNQEEAQENSFPIRIFTEFMDQGSLEDVLNDQKEYPLIEKLHWLQMLARGLRRIHTRGFIHRDIKPSNLLINRFFELKIGDPGLSMFNTENESPFGGLDNNINLYSAPEIMEGLRATDKSDIYSFGLVAYELFTTPYERISQLRNKKDFSSSKNTDILMPLIKACLRLNPEERPDAITIEDKVYTIEVEFWNYVKNNDNVLQLFNQADSNSTKDEILLNVYFNINPEFFNL